MRKNYLIALLGLFLVFLLAVSVSAISITKTFDADNPTFGSDTQKASNPSENENKYVTTILTVDNDLTTDIQVTGISYTSSETFESPGVDIVAQTDTTQFPITITTGNKGDINVKARIPHDLDAVDELNLEEKAFKVGVLTINTDGGDVNVDVYMQRENNLELDGNVFVNDKKKGDLEDDIDQIRPGSNIRVEYTIENKFSKSADVELESVEFEIRGESDLDADDTDDVDDIDADEEETGELEFDLDQDIDDGKYDIEFLARAEDKYGAIHGMSFKNQVEVDRETHDVIIEKSSLSPTTAQCGDTVEVKVDLLNIGKKDEEDVYVKLQTSAALGIKEDSERFDLDENDDRTVRMSFEIPGDAEEKDYIVSLEVLGDNTFDDNTDALTLKVEGGCFVPTADEIVSLTSTSLTANTGEKVNVDVQVLNTGNIDSTYTVELNGADAWANIVSPKTVTVPAGESALVSLVVSPQDDLEDGTYSATVVVKRGTETVFTQDVSVTFESEDEGNKITGGAFLDTTSGKISFVIVDIILILIIIWILVKIFSRKKAKEEM